MSKFTKRNYFKGAKLKLSKDKSYLYGGLFKLVQQKRDHNLPWKVILCITTKLLSKEIDVTFDWTDFTVKCYYRITVKDTGSIPLFGVSQ